MNARVTPYWVCESGLGRCVGWGRWMPRCYLAKLLGKWTQGWNRVAWNPMKREQKECNFVGAFQSQFLWHWTQQAPGMIAFGWLRPCPC